MSGGLNLLAMQSSVSDEVFNVASGRETSLLELLQALLKVMGKQQVRPTFLPERTVNPVPRRLGDVRKAEQLLGFCSEVSLEEGLDHLVAWRREVLRRGEEAAYEASHTPKAIGLLANSPNPS